MEFKKIIGVIFNIKIIKINLNYNNKLNDYYFEKNKNINFFYKIKF